MELKLLKEDTLILNCYPQSLSCAVSREKLMVMHDSVAVLHSSALCSLVETYTVIGKTKQCDIIDDGLTESLG